MGTLVAALLAATAARSGPQRTVFVYSLIVPQKGVALSVRSPNRTTAVQWLNTLVLSFGYTLGVSPPWFHIYATTNYPPRCVWKLRTRYVPVIATFAARSPARGRQICMSVETYMEGSWTRVR